MTLLLTAEELIDLLDLEPLPIEGGFFRQTYVVHGHPELGSADPQVSAIFYLVTPEAYSALHRLRYDEMFHFYLGDPCSMIVCDQSGTLDRITLGHEVRDHQQVQQLVPAGSWQGLRLRDGGRFALLGTTMSPGFRPDAFELAAITDVDGFASDVRESLLPFLAPSRPAP
ncbi:MAG TPA: cupin domain-containing protein [Thermomicrobiales bacterium]|nr:cupin domain-containing protein [Thermomicrobiales bacterium]